MRHARIIYVRARSAVSISNRAIARRARARTELEQGRVRAGQHDSDVPSDVERLTYRSVTDNLPFLPVPPPPRNLFCYL